MTNSRFTAEPATATPPAVVTPAGKPRRTGSRRVSAPAGPPRPAAGALVIVDAGVLVSAEASPVVEPLPAPSSAVAAATLMSEPAAPAQPPSEETPDDVPSDTTDSDPVPTEPATGQLPPATEQLAGEESVTETGGDPVPDPATGSQESAGDAAEATEATEATESDPTPTPPGPAPSPVEHEDESLDAAAAESLPAEDHAAREQTPVVATTAVAPLGPDVNVEAAEADEPVPVEAAEADEPVPAEAAEADEPVPAEAAEVPVPAEAAEADVADADALEPVPELAHASRRERRLAEQGLISNPTPAAAAPEAPPAASAAQEPDEVATPALVPAPRKRRSRVVLVLRALLIALLLAAIVLALGTVVSGQKSATAGPTATELARQGAVTQTHSALAAAQTQLGVATSDGTVAALTATTAMLPEHLAALSDGLPASEATTAPAQPVAADVADVLAQNAAALLQAATTAEGAMGRVFASVGVSQFLQAAALRTAEGQSPPAVPSALAHVTATSTTAPAPVCTTLLDPQPGASADAALILAAQGEQRAVYAYQVSASRMDATALALATELVTEHAARLTLLNAELTLRCLPTTAPVAAFRLDPAFTSTPAAALAGLEAELAVGYADVAALGLPLRDPLVSNDAGPAATGHAPATSQLRTLAVAALLDTTRAAQAWGAAPSALPGYATAAR